MQLETNRAVEMAFGPGGDGGAGKLPLEDWDACCWAYPGMGVNVDVAPWEPTDGVCEVGFVCRGTTGLLPLPQPGVGVVTPPIGAGVFRLNRGIGERY